MLTPVVIEVVSRRTNAHAANAVNQAKAKV
jgi:hypothetical protein